MPDPVPLDYQTPPERSSSRDDWAYIAPMAAFLACIWVGTKGPDTPHGNLWYPWSYLARTLLAGGLLIFFWKHYTRIHWNHWWLGLLVGILGIVQWVGMQSLLEKHVEFFKPSEKFFNPDQFFHNDLTRWAFIALRLLGAVIVVPIMEELFWRDFAWRTLIAPNDFKLASVGEWDLKAFLIVPLVFSAVHGNWWLTAIVWALMIGALLAYTRSLGACIIAHATTNLLLAAWVLKTKQWWYW